MSDSKSAVFLSYASQDAEAAKRICGALRQAGVEVWFDQSELRGGDAWDAKIRKQIKECALFVPLVSVSTQARREAYFRLEWKLAEDRSHLMARGTPFILPVAIDATTERGALVPDAFLAVQWTRWEGGEAPTALAARVQSLLGEESPTNQSPAFSRPIVSPVPAANNLDRSVAVLAFANLSNDRDNEYFSDGISEELLNVLAKVPGLKVTARTSAFHFKGKDMPIPEIARQLGVAYVVEGSVRKVGNRVRITAQLIKAADGFHVWSETFDRNLEDIFAVQDEIAGLIAKNLQLKLDRAPAPKAAVNAEAYQLALQGRAIYNREVPDDYPEALRYYEESLRIDPGSATTWGWLAKLYTVMGGFGNDRTVAAYEQARAAALRMIELNPRLAEGHSILAVVHIAHDFDWARAAAELQRAAELAPGDPDIARARGLLATALGQCEQAVAFSRQALDADPLNWLRGYLYGRALLLAGRYAEAEKFAGHLIALHPAGYLGLTLLSHALLLQGRIDEAAAAAEKIPHRFRRLVSLAWIRHSQGRPAESEAALRELKETFKEHGAYQIAEVHAWRGEPDEAFTWLEKAREQHDAGIPVLKCDPWLASLHADPRWEALLRKMNLADNQLA
jgi:TolB-like protein/Flp pilus assembly protein TadD